MRFVEVSGLHIEESNAAFEDTDFIIQSGATE